jgi:phosphatidylserine/phosphatidylglycerophosphate/cardiolipin synthase-like enzyme
VRLAVHATERRVPDTVVAALRDSGVAVARVGDARRVPMHNKFLVLDRGSGAREAWVGSFNYNPSSRWLNDEILLRTEEVAAVSALAARFEEMWAASP